MVLSLAAFTLALSAAELPSLTLLVGNKDENSMVFVDPATNQVLGKVATGNGPHEIAASSDGKLYFTAEANRVVGRYDPAANIGGNSISIIERNNVTTVPVGQGPEAIDLSPDGRELWTAHSRDGGVSVIDVAAKRVAHTFNIGTKRSNRLRFTPDGGRVLVSDLDGNEVIVIDAASRREVKRIAMIDLKTLAVTGHFATGDGPDGMAWSDRR